MIAFQLSKVKQEQDKRVYIRPTAEERVESSSQNCTLSHSNKCFDAEESRKFSQPEMESLGMFLVISLVLQVENENS